jgi:hypothetical protein
VKAPKWRVMKLLMQFVEWISGGKVFILKHIFAWLLLLSLIAIAVKIPRR